MYWLPDRPLVLVLALQLGVGAVSATERSSSQRAAFVRENPCPATGKTHGACPGWVVDHIVPICADGPDHPSNMQWQDVDSAKAKDGNERQQCRAIRTRRLVTDQPATDQPTGG
ncbi:MAG TPA: HNH endonuclease signature motif containing protein [Candidatus Accumulibacter phosphatis]|nr:HNH endonuclease signature motif containing protein [Candidatus Accumulibacter phosphatis]